MFRSTTLTRRRFLRASGGLALGGAAAIAGYAATQRRLRVGLIGCGGRGRQLANVLRWTRPRPTFGEVVAVCDVDRQRAEACRQEYFPAAEACQHFASIVERDDVDAVFVATPDHWHAAITLAALRAGKAVYCEKPLTLTVREGQMLVRAVRETGGIVQVGTQQRSSTDFQTACDLVRNGRLGNLRRVTVTLPTGSLPASSTGGPFDVESPPPQLDWDLWLGQAPWVDFCKQRFDPFRWWFEYSGGFMTDWGTHHLDIVHWALGPLGLGPLTIESEAVLPHVPNGYNTPRQFRVEMQYPGGVQVRVELSESTNGILFEGDEGRIFVNRKRLSGKPVEELVRHPLPPDAQRVADGASAWGTMNDRHVLDFFAAIATGKQPRSDVESQHRSATACHLANISMRLGRKIVWDAATEQISGDAEAGGMLTRQQREPYAVV